jgi:DNA-binding NtrC family response regulator
MFVHKYLHVYHLLFNTVLDMIMDPGIDGLETYIQILKRHPKQKTIIASGFSDNDRVKQAQGLGAGEYLKKPYTLEQIDLAFKEALEKKFRSKDGSFIQEFKSKMVKLSFKPPRYKRADQTISG